MKLLAVGTSYRQAPIELRERMAFSTDEVPQKLEELARRVSAEAVILNTCNRIEVYLAGTSAAPNLEMVVHYLCSGRTIAPDVLHKQLYTHADAGVVRHLFRVSSSLDSMIVGEGQISGQVRSAYELACKHGTAGPMLHALFQHARRVVGRVRTETAIAKGHASISAAAVDYVREVFDHFDDKTVLVIGAGKMSELTVRHLKALCPRRLAVTNRTAEKAAAMANSCGGIAVPWEELDEALIAADIVLSSTGATEPIVTKKRFAGIEARRRQATPLVILDIAVPRDFEASIHDGDRTFIFNIDDLKEIQAATLAERMKHVGDAELIIDQEVERFIVQWNRRRHGPVIAHLTEELETKRKAIVDQLFTRLNGRLTDADRDYIEGAFRLLQNQFLHAPITALAEDQPGDQGHTLLEALKKLFGLTARA